MPYRSLSLKQFRSYDDFAVEFSPQVNIIVGPNGSGKTNLLEALYVLSQGSSFRVGDKDLVQHDQQWFRLEGVYDDQQRVLLVEPAAKPPKQFNLDGVKRQRLSHQQRIPLVLFEPNELRLLHGSPQRRRDYIDGLLSRLWPDAGRRRSQFERALLQRNNIIKQAAQRGLPGIDDQLFVWDIKLAEYAEALVERRHELLEHWNDRLSPLYSDIAGTKSTIEVQYKSDMPLDGYKAHLLQQLAQRRGHDLTRGFTSVGPHRDDIVVLLNGVDAAVSASRGEIRSLVLSLKMIELDLLNELSLHPPLLLMDDVFSELDAKRRHALAQLAQAYQTVITTTDADSITQHFVHDHKIIAMQ